MSKDKWRLLMNLFTAFLLTSLGVFGLSSEYHKDEWPIYVIAGIVWFGYIINEWGTNE